MLNLREIQKLNIILTIEGGLLFALINFAGSKLLLQFLPNLPNDVLGLLTFLYGLILGSLLAGMWVSILQNREHELSWVLSGIIGMLIGNGINLIVPVSDPAFYGWPAIVTVYYDYFFILPIGILSWLGGKLGIKLKTKFRRRK